MKRLLLLLSLFVVGCASQQPKEEIAVTEHVTEEPPQPEPQKAGLSVQEISKKGSFFKINAGSEEGIALGKRFAVLSPTRETLFEAEVVGLRPHSAFLRVKNAKAPPAMLQVGLTVEALAP